MCKTLHGAVAVFFLARAFHLILRALRPHYPNASASALRLHSPQQERIEQHSFLVWTVLGSGVCKHALHRLGLTELMCVFPRVCLAHEMMPVLNKEDLAACSCW